LLADLVRAALPADFDVVVRGDSPRGWRRWDVAVVSLGSHGWVRARHIVTIPPHVRVDADRAPRLLNERDFGSLVALVRRLCDLRPAG
jgi:hypothetical protein